MHPGEVLQERFQLRERLRRGGMGETWTADDLCTQTVVVIKTPAEADRASRSTDEDRERGVLLKRFEREIDQLARMDHPGIPALVARGYDGVPFMAMEYIEGSALDVFLKEHTPTVGTTVAIMVQLLEILDYAHSLGVIHRDVKPHNLIVGIDGRVRLIDFGIAYLTAPDATRYTEDGATPGSLGYKAPEVINGDAEFTPYVDVYGAGCVFFLLLTGRRPFEVDNPREMEQRHLHQAPPRVRDFIDHVPPAVDDLVARMLAKTPQDRPTAKEAAEVIRPHLPGPGAPAPSPAPNPDPTRMFREPPNRPRPQQHRPRVSSRRPTRPRTDRPSRAEYAQLLAKATEEVDAGEPGPAVERLEQTLSAVRAAWGRYRPIAQACLRCGDAARKAGAWARARARYRDAERQLAGDDSPEGALLLLEAHIGIVECLAPEGRFEEAAADWLEVARRLLALDPPPLRLVGRLRMAGLELIERGHGAAIRPTFDRLPEVTEH